MLSYGHLIFLRGFNGYVRVNILTLSPVPRGFDEEERMEMEMHEGR